MANTDTLENMVECCKRVDPCKAVCELENVHLDLLMGKRLRSYTIGGESFTLFQPDVNSLLAAIDYFKSRCLDCQNGSDGLTRRRLSHTFIHSKPKFKRYGC